MLIEMKSLRLTLFLDRPQNADPAIAHSIAHVFCLCQPGPHWAQGGVIMSERMVV